MMRVLALIIIGFFSLNLHAQETEDHSDQDKLVVLWTSDDPYVAERVAFMYTHTARAAGWYDEVTLIVWGPSAKLLAENVRIQEMVRDMERDGVVIEACITCANDYGVSADLDELGFVNLKPMGEPLTEYIKSGAYVLTF
ncbi:MAG: DsrE family protein [Bacteroidales bacterium]